VGVPRVGHIQCMQCWRAGMKRSGVGGNLTPKAEYQMQCIQYWPMMEIDGGGHGGSI
jgi:hypothetical protein